MNSLFEHDPWVPRSKRVSHQEEGNEATRNTLIFASPRKS